MSPKRSYDMTMTGLPVPTVFQLRDDAAAKKRKADNKTIAALKEELETLGGTATYLFETLEERERQLDDLVEIHDEEIEVMGGSVDYFSEELMKKDKKLVDKDAELVLVKEDRAGIKQLLEGTSKELIATRVDLAEEKRHAKLFETESKIYKKIAVNQHMAMKDLGETLDEIRNGATFKSMERRLKEAEWVKNNIRDD